MNDVRNPAHGLERAQKCGSVKFDCWTNTECHPPNKNPKREGVECFSYKKVNLTILYAISLHIIFNISLDYQDIDSADTLQC